MVTWFRSLNNFLAPNFSLSLYKLSKLNKFNVGTLPKVLIFSCVKKEISLKLVSNIFLQCVSTIFRFQKIIYVRNKSYGTRNILTACSYDVTYTLQTEFTLYSSLKVKELLARNARDIWSLSDWPVWQNGWVFIYELSDCVFESHRCQEKFCFGTLQCML